MSSLGTQDALFISEDLNENLYLAARNLYHAGVCDASSIDPVSLIGFDNVVITKDALKKIEESIV
jgi:large subunit ribosomal protein L4